VFNGWAAHFAGVVSYTHKMFIKLTTGGPAMLESGLGTCHLVVSKTYLVQEVKKYFFFNNQ